MTSTATTQLAVVVQTGLDWLLRGVQPDDAWLQHHGSTAPTIEGRQAQFIPIGDQSDPLVVFDKTDVVWREDPNGDRVPENPYTDDDVSTLLQLLQAHGANVLEHWNGAGTCTVSFRLTNPVSPSLRAAVLRYHAGCSEHRDRRVFCECEAWRAGFRRAVFPTYPPYDGTARGGSR